MHDVNWWLMALAFLLGLVLTFLLMIGRVTREVPIYAALGRGPKVDVKAPAVDVKKPAVDVKAPDVDVKKGAPVAAAAAAAPVVAKVIKDEPYGAGSVRFAKSVAPPRAEYLVKGDEDTMRYFTVESPDYEKVGAEVWFKDTDSAERAGFLRWDAVAKGAAATAAAATGAATAATVASVAGSEDGPYGAGSARSGEGGVGPAGWLIKGNEDSGLYHTPASPSYEVTIAELWFVDEATAEAAGFKKYK
ncbi:MAG: hypothetical protein U0R18_07400 [Mycobacterium sp.]